MKNSSLQNLVLMLIIDLLTNTYTKSVPIKLNNNYEQDYQTIEFTLKSELLKAIQR